MTTFIIYNISETVDENGQKSFSTVIQYDGIEIPLRINFKDSNDPHISDNNDLFVLAGNFKEEVKPLRISLSDAYFDRLPQEIDYFVSQKARVRIGTYNDITICVDEDEIYVSCSISKDRKIIKKIEFGRYVPLEKPEYVRKSTSWTKGVFINDNDLHIKFLQSSWFGEDGEKYCLKHNKQNEKIILDVLQIPFKIGWTEEDTAVGDENYYKAKASVNINGKNKQWSYNLLDIGEQDIPLITDFPLRWLLRFYYDGFWCNSKRRVDKTIVLPINHGRKNNC